MTIDSLIPLMEAQKAFHWRVKSTSGDMLAKGTCPDSPSGSVDELRDTLSAFASAGRVVVEAADGSMIKQNWRGHYKWTVDLTPQPVAAAGAVAGPPAVPSGYVPQAVMDASLAAIRQEVAHTKEMLELRAEIDKIKTGGIPPAYLPLAAKLCGFGLDEIKQLQGLSGLGDVGTLSQEGTDTDNAPSRELVAELEANIVKLSEKVSVEDINTLVKALIKKPSLVKKALTFI